MVAYLSVVVEDAIYQAKLLNDTYLESFKQNTFKATSKVKLDMENTEYIWLVHLTKYKEAAQEKHFDISSCLGQSEKNLEQLFPTNYQYILRCTNAVDKIVEENAKNTKETVRFH